MLDTHIIDCERCERIGHAIVEHREKGLPPWSPEIAAFWRRALEGRPPFALPADDFDHFVERCCDGRTVFANIRLVKAYAA